MSKTQKIAKEFLLTDSTVNSYGFRLLTSGYLIDEFKRNPIGYDMHARDKGVIVKWEDFRVDGDQVFAKPVINLNHPDGQRVLDDVENGFKNAASVGHIVVLEMSDDPALKLPNQIGPTMTKWFNREASLVDIPGNYNALKLYDKDEREINLSDFSKQKPLPPPMKTITINPLHLSLMKLNADADETQFNTTLTDLVAKAARVDALQSELTTLKNAGKADRVKNLLATAEQEGRITKEVSTQFAKDYADNPDGLDVVLKAMPAQKSIVDQITKKDAFADKRVQDLVAKGFDDLMDTGEILELKKLSPEAYKQLYKQTLGVDPR